MGKDLKGKNIGKGFTQRKDGRYEARANINGKKIDIYDTDLSRLKKTFEIEKAKLLINDNSIKSDTPFGEWYDEWFETCKKPQLRTKVSADTYNRKTKNTYRMLMQDIPLSELTQLDIQKATNTLSEKDYSERTIREALGVVRQCLEVAVINKMISSNPCQNINIKNKNAQEEMRVLSKKEQKIFLNEVENDYYNEAYQILLLTGMRIGEFSGLQWRDVDFDNKCIKINRSLSTGYFDGNKIEELTPPKTYNGYRSIPFFDNIEDLFIAWKEKQDMYKAKLGHRWRTKPELGDLVFTSTMGSPVSRYVLAHDINKVVKNYNDKERYMASYENREPEILEHLSPYTFRHTFATRCFEKKMNPLFVQKIMGHANYSTTVSYTHLLDDAMQEELQKAVGFFE